MPGYTGNHYGRYNPYYRYYYQRHHIMKEEQVYHTTFGQYPRTIVT